MALLDKEHSVSDETHRLEVPLSAGGVPVLVPMFLGLYGGILLRSTLSLPPYQLSDGAITVACLAVSIAITLLAVAIKRRQLPDRLRVTSDTVEFARGKRAVSRVRLAKLAEINEIELHDGKVLVLSDDRQTLAVIAAHLADPRQYAEITHAITEAVGRVDPSGSVARMAVQAARLREVVARRPMRATFILAAGLAVAFYEASRALHVLQTEPFPLEDLGALSLPLIRSEMWRLVSYAFVDSSELRFLFCLLSVLWIGGALEKLVGWERMLFCLLAGIVGGAIAYAMTGAVMPVVGLQGGVFGLIGLLSAASLRARKGTQALKPPGTAWFMGAWFTLFMLVKPLWLTVNGLHSGRELLALVGGAWGLSLIVGLATLAGVDVPVSNTSRREWRWFGIASAACLVVGLVGGVTHHKRQASHALDNELLTRSLVDLPPGPESAMVQNRYAYTWAQRSDETREGLEVASRLAMAAVLNSPDGMFPSTLDTYAVARYKLHDAAEAEVSLDEAEAWQESMPKPSDPELVAADQGTLDVIRRHLEDVKSGNPLRADPDEPATGIAWPLGIIAAPDAD